LLKIVYSDPKTGKTGQAEVTAEITAQLLNMKIGETLDGALFGLAGYKLKITGGSDNSGFPMIKNAHGSRKMKANRDIGHGTKERLTVVGNAIGPATAQINTVIVEYGSKTPEEIFPPPKPKEEKAKKEEKPAAKK
jgi:small subunit ribosomal protein S6e